jgi:hypothetical protein
MTMNGTGQYQTLFTGSGTSVTSNYGNNWTNIALSIGNDTGGSSSSETGQYQIVVIGNSANYSTNYGYNWTSTGISTAMSSCAISKNGMVTTVSSANVFTSVMPEYVTLGDTVNQNTIATFGNVAINKTSVTSGFALDVNGNIRYVAATATSDYRVKQNVKPLDETFNVDNLRPVSYYNTLSNNQDVGLIAHELQKYYPSLVHGNKDDEDYQSVNYTSLISVLIHEIQQLKKRIIKLENNTIDPSNNTDPVVPSENTEPVVPSENTEPVAPTENTDPVAPVENIDPVVPSENTEPVVPSENTEPVVPTENTEPVVPTENTEPVVPTENTEPVAPTENTDENTSV